MTYELNMCEHCGKIFNNKLKYEIKAFHDGKSDGGFIVCWSCYCDICESLNKKYLKTQDMYATMIKTLNEQIKKEVE